MRIFPYQNGDQLIELVEKREYDTITLLAHDLANLRAEDMATINDLRKELQAAVKRMEAIPVQELDRIWDDAPGGSPLVAIDAVRDRLIQAAKGEQL